MRAALTLALVLLLSACSGSGRESLQEDLSSRSDAVPLDDAEGGADVTAVDSLGPDLPGPADVVVPPDLPGPTDVPVPDVAPVDVTPVDIGPDSPLLPAGCCFTAADCPEPDMVCGGLNNGPPGHPGVCLSPPDKEGWCHGDAHCEMGQECHGAAACGCEVDCDPPYLGPGICVPEAPGCVPIEESWVTEICNAASLVIFDGKKCLATCPGCCGCEPFCEFTFDTIEACENACNVSACPTYVGALADESYNYVLDDVGCVDWQPMAGACHSDGDCPQSLPDGSPPPSHCVLGNCVYCWQDSQCGWNQNCRAGRCVPESGDGCYYVPCNEDGCHLVTPSENPCPVCVCDSIFNIGCQTDEECMIYSFHPFQRCVYGRCGDCRNDADCPNALWGYGDTCLAPGVCYDMQPYPHVLYGTWLVGWAGGMDHFSYFRFEPDGTLRRGAYSPEGAWSDDFPSLPCWPDGVWPSPLLGTWEPEITQSGFLVVKVSLNISCAQDAGYSARFSITPGETWEDAVFNDIDSDWQYMAMKVPTESCLPDFSFCETPAIY